MKSLYFLLFVAACQGRVVRETKDIPAPTVVSLTAVEPLGFVVDWTPVKSGDSSDPVLGYKVKVWEQTKVKQYHYDTIDGVKVLVEENVPVEFPNSDKIPEGKPKEYLVQGADKTTLKVEHIEIGVTYETRVQAYTKTKEGPLSLPVRIQIMPNEKDRKKDIYTVS